MVTKHEAIHEGETREAKERLVRSYLRTVLSAQKRIARKKSGNKAVIAFHIVLFSNLNIFFFRKMYPMASTRNLGKKEMDSLVPLCSSVASRRFSVLFKSIKNE